MAAEWGSVGGYFEGFESLEDTEILSEKKQLPSTEPHPSPRIRHWM